MCGSRVLALALIFLYTCPIRISAQRKIYAYNGPDGCTDYECDCSETTLTVKNPKNGDEVVTSTVSCTKSDPTNYIRIPPSALQFLQNLQTSAKEIFQYLSVVWYGCLERLQIIPKMLMDVWKYLWTSIAEAMPKTTSSLEDSCKSIKSTGWEMFNEAVEHIFIRLEMEFQRVRRFIFSKVNA